MIDIIHNDRVLETIPAGSIFGEMALIDKKNRSASSIAKTDCRVAVINERVRRSLAS